MIDKVLGLGHHVLSVPRPALHTALSWGASLHGIPTFQIQTAILHYVVMTGLLDWLPVVESGGLEGS